MTETKVILEPVIARYSWFKGNTGRIFFIAGIWRSADPDNDQVEVIELYRSIPIYHSMNEVKDLIASGDLKPIDLSGKTPSQTS